MIGAVIATEDASFHEHDGVNHESIVRAGLRNLQEGGIAEGASTITQQLVTMAFLEPEPTIERKLNEIVWAVELEERLGKDEILEGYLNRVYLGHGSTASAPRRSTTSPRPRASSTSRSPPRWPGRSGRRWATTRSTTPRRPPPDATSSSGRCSTRG
jgi:hypothetical protein